MEIKEPWRKNNVEKDYSYRASSLSSTVTRAFTIAKTLYLFGVRLANCFSKAGRRSLRAHV